jgi:hypothetical protein
MEILPVSSTEGAYFAPWVLQLRYVMVSKVRYHESGCWMPLAVIYCGEG